ncbi:hypothetical protein BY458DRAFT_526138 [Sporodiniella umbellata]|nr:hypothetical protein BY458DRAFT_526138 [Sporodiniella umbellata]
MPINAIVKQVAAASLPISRLRLRKAALTLTPAAVSRLKDINKESSKYLRVGVKQKGCSGNSYTLDFTETKGKFDEVVKQDGVTVLVDSKALITILGSEMDFVTDKLSEHFVFHNPNVKGTCGCGESFAL